MTFHKPKCLHDKAPISRGKRNLALRWTMYVFIYRVTRVVVVGKNRSLGEIAHFTLGGQTRGRSVVYISKHRVPRIMSLREITMMCSNLCVCVFVSNSIVIIVISYKCI